MAMFFALHTPIGDPAAGWEFFAKAAPALAAAMEAGQTSAKAITTWNPSAYGRGDYVFCLWEAEKPEDVMTTLRERPQQRCLHRPYAGRRDRLEGAGQGGAVGHRATSAPPALPTRIPGPRLIALT